MVEDVEGGFESGVQREVGDGGCEGFGFGLAGGFGEGAC